MGLQFAGASTVALFVEVVAVLAFCKNRQVPADRHALSLCMMSLPVAQCEVMLLSSFAVRCAQLQRSFTSIVFQQFLALCREAFHVASHHDDTGGLAAVLSWQEDNSTLVTVLVFVILGIQVPLAHKSPSIKTLSC